MADISTVFDWETAVEELDKQLIGFDYNDVYQAISDDHAIEVILKYFEWYQTNASSSERLFSLSDIAAEVQNANFEVVQELASIRLRYDPQFEHLLKEVRNEDDFHSHVDDLVAWHFEAESYSIYRADNDWVSDYFEIYDSMACYLADLMIDEKIMFELEDFESCCGHKPTDLIFANNCQNTLLDKFSFAKTTNNEDMPDDILVISSSVEASNILALGGGSVV